MKQSRPRQPLSPEDRLLARMQTAKARNGTEAAFSAGPVELGRAAVKLAKRSAVVKRNKQANSA
jgi:hypothetical protein